MSPVQFIFYREENGQIPVLDWLYDLEVKEPKVYAKCVILLKLLQNLGHNIRRPHADYLRDKIYELRIDLKKRH